MSDTRVKAQSLLFSALMVTSMFVGVVALGGTAAGASSAAVAGDSGLQLFSPPSNTDATDNTKFDRFTPGTRSVAANVTYSSPGNVGEIALDLSGPDSNNLTADDIDEVDIRVFNGGTEVGNASADYTGPGQVFDVSSGTNVLADKIEIVVTASSVSENNDKVDAVYTIEPNDTTGTATFDTNENQTIATTINARLTGEVEFQNGSPAENVTIDVINTDTGTVAIDNITTGPFDGKPPGEWGPRIAPPGNYTVVLDPNSPLADRYSDFSTDVRLEADETEKIFTTLDENLYATSVDCSNIQAFVDEGGTLEIVVRDQNGDRLADAPVSATKISGSADINLIETGESTNANGVATLNVSGSSVGQATFRISVPTIPDVSGGTVTDECTATFIQSGEGEVTGTVYNKQTTNPVEDANVWAVLADQYESNTVNFSISHAVDDDNVYWFRVIDNETGEVVDNDMYDVRASEEADNEGTGVRMIEALNSSNDAAGQGFAVINTDPSTDSLSAWNITRLENREYRLQWSQDAWNASDLRLNETTAVGSDPGEREDFFNVSSWDQTVDPNQITGVSGTPIVFSPPANLTLARSIELARLSGSNFVDAVGFTNSYGVDTDGTNQHGQFLLDRLFTDFQAGRTYVAVATKPGFSADFADVHVSEDGRLEFTETGDSQTEGSFQIEPEPVDADLNITNYARLNDRSDGPSDTQNLSAYTDAQKFDNMTDAYSQRLSRDGEVVDVVLVETTAEESGEPISREVTLEVPDVGDNTTLFGTSSGSNFQGDWFAPSDVLLSEDPYNDTITVQTNANGTAVVWLTTDTSSSDLTRVSDVKSDVKECPEDLDDVEEDEFSGITAFVTSDTSARDTTCKDFAGVTQFKKASISGFLSDNRDERVGNTFVWIRDMAWDPAGGERIAIRADGSGPSAYDDPTDTFTVTHYVDADGDSAVDPGELVLGSKTVTREDLAAFEFGAEFPEIDSNGPFKLGERSGPDDTEFTLKDVPTVPTSSVGFPDGLTNYNIRGIVLGDTINRGEIGNATAETKPGFTDDANIAFGFRGAVQFVVENGSLSAPSTVTEGQAFTVTADITNEGSLVGSENVEFRVDLDGDGTLESGETLLTNTSVSLGAGETGPVRFDIPAGTTSGLNGTDIRHGVFTIDATTGVDEDNATALIDINAAGGSGIDVNDDGNLSTNVDADPLHEDVNGDGVFDTRDVQTLLDDLTSDRDAVGNAGLFDFDGSGGVNTGDVQALLDEVIS